MTYSLSTSWAGTVNRSPVVETSTSLAIDGFSAGLPEVTTLRPRTMRSPPNAREEATRTERATRRRGSTAENNRRDLRAELRPSRISGATPGAYPDKATSSPVFCNTGKEPLDLRTYDKDSRVPNGSSSGALPTRINKRDYVNT